MICHEFKGGIGTASRVVDERPAAGRSACSSRRTTAGATWLRVDGVPVGEAIPTSEVPEPVRPEDRRAVGSAPPAGLGLDHRRRRDRCAAPAPPVRAARPAGRPRDRPDGRHGRQLERRPVPRASRPATGRCPAARPPATRASPSTSGRSTTTSSARCSTASIEATEEAILNALVAAETMTGRDGDHRPRPAPRPARPRRSARHGRRSRPTVNEPGRPSGRRPAPTSPAIRATSCGARRAARRRAAVPGRCRTAVPRATCSARGTGRRGRGRR